MQEAKEHRVAAGVLEKRYADTCALVGHDKGPFHPLDGHVRAVDQRERGVDLRLGPDAGPPDVLLAEIQCHTAWLQLAPRPEAANDVMAITDVQYAIRAEPDAVVVTITATSPEAVEELRRRAEILRANEPAR